MLSTTNINYDKRCRHQMTYSITVLKFHLEAFFFPELNYEFGIIDLGRNCGRLGIRIYDFNGYRSAKQV